MSVKQVFRVRGTEGDVGIEIEAEGVNLPRADRYWNRVHDGSLRGDGLDRACEYVLKRPMTSEEAQEALTYLEEQYKENGTVVNDSPRCGVHVHINCQRMSVLHLYNFMVLYLILEDVLVKWCGPTREGNLFCLRAKDAEYLLYVLSRALEEKSFRRRFSTDEVRYASMNIRSLPTYGSLEFRAMEGTDDMERIGQWADMLLELREAATQYANPIEMIMSTSEEGPEAFVRHVLSEPMANLIFSHEGWEMMVREGSRRVQEVAYAGDWDEMANYPPREVGGVAVSPDWDDDFPEEDV